MATDDDLRFDHGTRTPERLKRQLSRLTAMTAAQLGRVAGDALQAVGAHKAHFVVLAALEEFGPASQATLSGRTRIYTSDLVAVLNELVGGGWVRRAPDPSDKRRNIVSVTASGRRRLAELDRILDDVNEQAMAPLNRSERSRLFELLGRVNANLADRRDPRE